MKLPNGSTRTTGIFILFLGLILPLFRLRLSDAAPVEMAQLVDTMLPVIGTLVTVYGEYRAKGVMWISKNK